MSLVTDVVANDQLLISISPPSCSLFTFETDQPGEISLVKDELVEVAQKDEAGGSATDLRCQSIAC